MCLATITVLSLHALGYMDQLDKDGHVPATFSWQTLREFFAYQDYVEKDCLFYNRESRLSRKIGRTTGVNELPGDVDYAIVDSLNHEADAKKEINTFYPNPHDCDARRNRRSTDWLLKLLYANIIPVLNIITSTTFLISLRVRRRKGLQVMVT